MMVVIKGVIPRVGFGFAITVRFFGAGPPTPGQNWLARVWPPGGTRGCTDRCGRL